MNLVSMKRTAAVKIIAVGVSAFAFLGLVFASSPGSAGTAASKYIGADKCKNCHSADESGNQYAHWQKSKHAKAFETLASDAAKKAAKEKGIEDPQKSEQCLKCHVTAFGVAEADIKKGFDVKAGVQCEGCHGPGEAHMKARFAEAAKADPTKKGERQKVPADEINAKVDAKVCQGCHNEQSPTFKPFCIHARATAIRHLDPRNKHEGETMICGCAAKDGCTHKCDDKCGGLAK